MNTTDQVRKLFQWERQRMRVEHEAVIRTVPRKIAWLAILFFALVWIEKAFSSPLGPCLVYLSRVNQNQMLELTASRDGSTVGKMIYSQNDGQAYIGAIVVDHLSRRSGVSTALIEHMLEREPHTHEISAVLILDNYRATGLGRLLRDATEAECMAAVKNSPLYKTASRFGFMHVTQCVHSRRTDMVSVTLGLQ